MVGIFICMPIFTLIYFIIRLDSEGPGIFIQDRVGLNGQVFKMYKFRTMVKNAEELKSQYSHLNETNSPLFKIKNDPRLTRVGNFLRNSNLDELPQLVNVLKGQMSLVGPRPFLCAEFPQFEPWQKERLKVRSGMTSFWHVYGRQILPVDFQSWVESDLEYTKKMNLLLDFKIVMKTIFMVFNHINNMVFLRLRK
jgi:lipopolysaccharide/colanic/teichoic acid biosynthesis glycosyltransferase